MVGKVMDTLLGKVMRCVDAQERKLKAQDQLKESNKVVEDILDKMLLR